MRRAAQRRFFGERRLLASSTGVASRLQGFTAFGDTLLRFLEDASIKKQVLADEMVRGQIKIYSDWPTIPQLYVDGEFVGGSDIMLEMYQAGELQEMIEVASAS